MIDVLEFPNGKNHPDRHETCKLRSTENVNMKVKKTVIQCKRNQSQNVVPYETCYRLEFHLRKIPGRGK